MSNDGKKTKRRYYLWIVLAVLPLIVAGLYGTLVNLHLYFRYDEDYFQDSYNQKYQAPGPVALAVEKAIQTGDSALFQELSGMRRSFKIEANPDVVFTVLLDVDDRGYFHYLYLDMSNYRRSTYYIKQVGERWVVVPDDLYFFWDSGLWWDVFLPIALVWWVVLTVVWLVVFVYRISSRIRESMHR